MPIHYYIWYHVSGDLRAVRAAVDAMLNDLYQSTGVRGRLLVGRDTPSTWMEVYEGVTGPAEFESELVAAILRHGLARYVPAGGRHVEAFVAPKFSG
ncbi:MAG: DUF4936 family protein [Betaproteobacteria bacterium]